MTTFVLRTKNKEPAQFKQDSKIFQRHERDSVELEKLIVCKVCEHTITKPNLAIDSVGKTYENPLGISYHIVCYKDAPGANDIGIPTVEHSWFPDHAWSFAHCAKCNAHLGWWFSGLNRFVGLISANVFTTG